MAPGVIEPRAVAPGVIEPRPFEAPQPAKMRILSIDGGGIRGLIPALFLARLEELLSARDGSPTLAESFDLMAGTSTGGLIALGLTAPRGGRPAMSAAQMVEMYAGEEGRRIFERPAVRKLPLLGRAVDLFTPKYSLGPLADVLEARIGPGLLGEALTEVIVTAYDMSGRGPRFFKRWRPADQAVRMVDAALATAAAPTFFPAHEHGGESLIDGGVFASNPTVAAIVEALKRTDDPVGLRGDDLLVVSLGTGSYETGFDQEEVEGWGAVNWVLPGEHGEPPLISAMLDGQSDAADHWAHVLLNHRPGTEMPPASEQGAGPRYFRYQVRLDRPLPMDDAGARNIASLRHHGEALVAAREDELIALAAALIASPPDG
ncbi:MAG: patatin-like phospholipase family protein [Actinomycetota bacterium]|nr:patatin-like phospholipase family protein [Actinomycetota bacterium]